MYKLINFINALKKTNNMNENVMGTNKSEPSDIFKKFAKYWIALILNNFSGLISTDKKGITASIENISAKPEKIIMSRIKKNCLFLFVGNLCQSLIESLKTFIDLSIYLLCS